MSLIFAKPERLWLKRHADFNEKWLQQRIVDDPSLLGIGDVEVVAKERVQHGAGRLDLLLHDDQLNRRYELELMLGTTDPDHILRCIEYWDVERRRYPAYEHVAILAAEDITSRFLNVVSLLAGHVPIIALQLCALKVDDKIVLHFVKVLDQTRLRCDDEYELAEQAGGESEQDRAYWEKLVPAAFLALCDQIRKLAMEISSKPHHLQYKKRLINVVADDGGEIPVWLLPRKTLVNLGGYVAQPEVWVKRFKEVGLDASLRRGNQAARVAIVEPRLDELQPLIREFVAAAITADTGE